METWSYVSGERLDEGEWPLRDAVPVAREVEVTPEMLRMADKAEQELADPFTSEEYFSAIYRAMHAVAPVAPARDEIGQLVGERDRALSRASHAMENWTVAVRERNEISDVLFCARQDVLTYGQKVLAQEAEIATLRAEFTVARDTIAKLTSSVVSDTPSAAPNPFREFGGDRRRIGG